MAPVGGGLRHPLPGALRLRGPLNASPFVKTGRRQVHSTGREASGVLRRQGPWLQGELEFADGARGAAQCVPIVGERASEN